MRYLLFLIFILYFSFSIYGCYNQIKLISFNKYISYNDIKISKYSLVSIFIRIFMSTLTFYYYLCFTIDFYNYLKKFIVYFRIYSTSIQNSKIMRFLYLRRVPSKINYNGKETYMRSVM